MRDTTSEQGDTVPPIAGVDGCRAGWVVVLAHPLARDAEEHQVTVCARFDEGGHGLSIQAFNILPKIREVDRVMTPALQQQVYEAHPELAFQALAGYPLQDRKKTVTGREARLRVLETIPGLLFHGIRTAFERILHACKRTNVAPDDILDAYVLVWTALRIWRAQAHRVPCVPPSDARGLRMEIWY